MEEFMRTTLTIDDDIMKALKQKAHDSGLPVKAVVNMALREGLNEMGKPKR